MPHKSQDDLDGFDYVAPDESWTIDPHVLIYSTSIAIFSGVPRSTLTNHGVIYGSSGLYFSSNDTVIKNKPDGLIKGINDGLFTGSGGAGLTIKNEGALIGANNIGVYLYRQSSAELTNTATGEIYGNQAGIGVFSEGAGGKFTNSGLIHSDRYGIDVETASGLTTKIANLKGGAIKGDSAAVHVGAGQISLTNHGKIVGDILSPSPDGKDTVFNDGKINGAISLGLGRDTVVFAGGSQGTVFGGSDKDKFVFKREFAPAKDAAVVGDFNPGTDTIELSRKLFKDIGHTGTLKSKYFHVGSHAGDGNDRIIYNSHNGHLSYDRDGTGSGHAVLFARLDANLNLDAGDFTVIA